MAIRENDSPLEPDDHPLSLTPCALCQHYQCYHDEHGCFLDPNGKKSQDPGILGRAALKATRSQCWCPKFVRDPDEAASVVAQLGDSEALMRAAFNALNRSDRENSRRLIDQYIFKTPIEVRDSDWVKAMQRRLETEASEDPIKREDFEDLTKLPAMLKEPSIDPIEVNPFPESHPAKKIWADATCKASEEVLRFRAEMLGATPNDPVSQDEWFLRLIVGQFDIWAKRFVHVVWTESMFEDLARWLVSYAESWLDSCRQMTFPPRPLDSFLPTVRRSLMARTEWWKAEARRLLSLLEKGASNPDGHERNPSADIDQDVKQQDSGHTVSPQWLGSERMKATLSSKKPLMVKYRSGIKRAILGAIMKNPNASDADVCRFLDADGGEELPAGWKARREDRSFFDAYSNPSARRKVEIAISKIRRDLRDRGLLP